MNEAPRLIGLVNSEAHWVAALVRAAQHLESRPLSEVYRSTS